MDSVNYSEDMRGALHLQATIGTVASAILVFLIVVFGVVIYYYSRKKACYYWIPIFCLSLCVIQIITFQIRWYLVDSAATSQADMKFIADNDGGAAIIPGINAVISSVVIGVVLSLVYYFASNKRNAT